MKTCSKCKESKPLDGYNVDRQNRDGKRGACRACQSQSSAKWRKDNPSAYRDWYVANRGSRARYNAAYIRENPDSGWEHRYIRRAKRFGVAPVVEPFTRDDLMAHLGVTEWACMECGSVDGVELDHIIPVSMGGPHTLDNCRPLCGPHNREAWQDVRATAMA